MLYHDGMADQLIPRDEVMMSKYNTNIFGTMDRRTIDTGFSNSMESSTVISMPYWLTMNPTDAANVTALGAANYSSCKQRNRNFNLSYQCCSYEP